MSRRILKKLNFNPLIMTFMILFSFCAVLTGRAEAQEVAAHMGTDFWLGFPQQQGTTFFIDAELYIQSDQPGNFTVTVKSPLSTVTGTVAPGSPKVVHIDRFSTSRQQPGHRK